MSQNDLHRARSLSLERLGELLDTYGAAPERWPDMEREAAQRLIVRSEVARARWAEAADLDRFLDTLPAEPPSPALAARVLATAPRRRPRGLWQLALAASVPLAAAAAVTLWLAREHEPARQITSVPVVIGQYTSPTDVLLEPYTLDVYATVPSIGCSDSILGCPNVNAADAPYSQRQSFGRLRA
jgi:hypothetical protein